jgi:hypothetical protein
MKRLAVAATLAMALAAHAETRPRDAIEITQEGGAYSLSVPASKLVMRLPSEPLRLKDNNVGGATSNPRYFYFESGSHDLRLSGWFEPASRYGGMDAFWEVSTKSWERSGQPAPLDVTRGKVGGWETAFYELVSRVTTSHVQAHWVQAGTWINLHVSVDSTGDTAKGRQRLEDLLKTIKVREK